MKRILLFLCLFVRAFATTGDIISVTVGAEGWYADVKMAGLTTGGTYAFGLGPNNDPATGTPKVTFTVVSLGYDDTGSATTLTRTVYGTHGVRTPYGTFTAAGTYTSGAFTEGETVTQATSGATGIVVIPASGGTKLFLRAITGSPDNSHVWTGGTSGATFTPSAVPVDYATGPREFNDGTNLTVRISLSDCIFSKDIAGAGFVANTSSGTAPVANLLAGFYTSSNASGAGFAVTNNSTATYPKVIGNWSWPGEGKITATSFNRRCVAFSGSGQQGRPVRVVKFTAADTHSHTDTVYVTRPSVDFSLGDAQPVVEYIATHDASTLTQGDLITCNFLAYPWVGDTAAVMDSSAGAAQPSPLVGPVTRLNDKSGTYGASYATVDPVSGVDASGAVSTTSGGNGGSPYLTMAAAYNALRSYNNTNFSRNNCGGSTMYLRTGTSAFVNGSVTLGTTPDTYLLITRHPSDAKSGVIIGNKGTGTSLGLKLKIQDVSMSVTDAAGTVSGGAGSWLWLDQCAITSASGTPFLTNTVWHLTRCTFNGFNMGIRPSGTTNAAPGIVRGNDLTGACNTNAANGVMCYTVIGNKKTDTATTPPYLFMLNTSASQTIPNNDNCIIAFNKVSNWKGNVIIGSSLSTYVQSGLAVVQNQFEFIGTVSFPAIQIAADGNTGTPYDNVLLWNNTVAGQRLNRAYNDIGSVPKLRPNWSEKNNLWEDNNIKSDTFNGNSLDGGRTGNWAMLYGVGQSGNVVAECTGIGAPGAFLNEFVGLSSYQPALSGSQPPNGTANVLGYLKFVGRAAYDGTSQGAGSGDYRLHTLSPAYRIQRDWLLPYDLNGKPRSGNGDSAGAVAEGGVRPASMMFGN